MEILVSLFVLTVGIIGVLALFPLGLKIQNSAKMESCGSRLAQEKIEEIISTPYGEIASESEDYGAIPDFPSFKRTASIDYYDPSASETTSEDTGIKKAKVEVFWESRMGFLREKAAFQTLISENR